MRIREALKKIEGTNKTISSKEAHSYSQDFASLCHWVFMMKGPGRTREYKKFRKATDWEVDKE